MIWLIIPMAWALALGIFFGAFGALIGKVTCWANGSKPLPNRKRAF
jgi:hypothetical protein